MILSKIPGIWLRPPRKKPIMTLNGRPEVKTMKKAVLFFAVLLAASPCVARIITVDDDDPSILQQ